MKMIYMAFVLLFSLFSSNLSIPNYCRFCSNDCSSICFIQSDGNNLNDVDFFSEDEPIKNDSSSKKIEKVSFLPIYLTFIGVGLIVFLMIGGAFILIAKKRPGFSLPVNKQLFSKKAFRKKSFAESYDEMINADSSSDEKESS